MSSLHLDLEEELIAVLRQFNQPVERSAKELIVLELCRQGKISGGKAAELLEMPRQAFVDYASRSGVPYFSMADEEWDAERRQSERL
jgi:predicted HTH domain antitoxin